LQTKTTEFSLAVPWEKSILRNEALVHHEQLLLRKHNSPNSFWELGIAESAVISIEGISVVGFAHLGRNTKATKYEATSDRLIVYSERYITFDLFY
jgi:hypothetical protein